MRKWFWVGSAVSMRKFTNVETFARDVNRRLVSARDSYRRFLESKCPVDRAHQLLRERGGAFRGMAGDAGGGESGSVNGDEGARRSGAGRVIAVVGAIWILRRLNRRKGAGGKGGRDSNPELS